MRQFIYPWVAGLALVAGCLETPDGLAEDTSALSPSPNDQRAFTFFVGKQLTDVQAAGIVGNLDQESQMDPGAVQPNGVGHGIAQWSEPGRWDDLVAYANSTGQAPGSLDVQLEFIWRELPSYGLARLRAATDVAVATVAFQDDYEQCGNCAQDTRIRDARAALAAYGGHSAPTTELAAFQANTGELWTTLHGKAGLGMMHGTSPSVAVLDDGGYEIAFQANTGDLWTTGTAGTRNWHQGMRTGTSPSIAALAGGGYVVAFQANTTSLFTAGTPGIRNWNLHMDSGSSPSITGLSDGGYVIAFQANTHNEWFARSAGYTASDARLGMRAGTSPSITALTGDRYVAAFQANTGELWTSGTAGTHRWGLGLDPASSPSIAATGATYTIAFQANTHALWFATSSNYAGTGATRTSGCEQGPAPRSRM